MEQFSSNNKPNMDSEEKKDSLAGEQPQGAEQPTGSDDTKDLKTEIKLKDGSKVTIEELQNGYMRQADYTRKTQELAKEKKPEQDTPSDTDDEMDEAVKALKEKGLISKEDLEKTISSMKTESEFKEFTASYDGLLTEVQMNSVQQLQALPDNKDLNFEEISEKYGFVDDAKLAKAKGNRRVMGSGVKDPQGEPDIEAIAGPKPKFLQ